MDYIKRLRKAIWRLHGCDAEYIETVPVTETFEGQTIWQGNVEVFKITGHPKAKRCYAWSHVSGTKDNNQRYVAVLELDPVNSAQTAVKAAIVDEFRRKEKK